jgi:hypothetical protein
MKSDSDTSTLNFSGRCRWTNNIKANDLSISGRGLTNISLSDRANPRRYNLHLVVTSDYFLSLSQDRLQLARLVTLDNEWTERVFR